MESPLKKKKLGHAITEENILGDQLVRLILDDKLESTMLKKKLGGNKIRTLHTISTLSEFTPSSISSRDTVRHIRTCPAQKLLFLGYYKSIHIYCSTSLNYIRKIEVEYNKFEVDDSGEYLYLIFPKKITKNRLDDLSVVWSVNEIVDFATIVESKNEIYTVNECGINVLDVNDGTVKRTFSYDLGRCICSGIAYDENEEMIYCSYNFHSEDSFLVDDNTSEPTCKLIIVDEDTSEITYIDHDQKITFIILYENYYLCYCSFGFVQIFEKNSNNLLMEYNLNIKNIGRTYYFDRSCSILWFGTGNNVAFNALDLMETIIENPLNKEICCALQKLGGVLPSFIPKLQLENEYIIPECLQYLSNIKFEQSILWFIDEEIAKNISFGFLLKYIYQEEWIQEHDAFLFGLCSSDWEMRHNKFAACLFVKKSEVSNLSNGDFPIYLRYLDESKDNFIISSWKLSEFVCKLSKAETVSLENATYSIHFEKIYDQLLSQQIINPNTKEIDRSILFEKYQKTVWGMHDDDYSIFNLVKYFNSSTIRFDNVDFKKMDLILLAESCKDYCFVNNKN